MKTIQKDADLSKFRQALEQPIKFDETNGYHDIKPAPKQIWRHNTLIDHTFEILFVGETNLFTKVRNSDGTEYENTLSIEQLNLYHIIRYQNGYTIDSNYIYKEHKFSNMSSKKYHIALIANQHNQDSLFRSPKVLPKVLVPKEETKIQHEIQNQTGINIMPDGWTLQTSKTEGSILFAPISWIKNEKPFLKITFLNSNSDHPNAKKTYKAKCKLAEPLKVKGLPRRSWRIIGYSYNNNVKRIGQNNGIYNTPIDKGQKLKYAILQKENF